jgi:hypothetical protein
VGKNSTLAMPARPAPHAGEHWCVSPIGRGFDPRPEHAAAAAATPEYQNQTGQILVIRVATPESHWSNTGQTGCHTRITLAKHWSYCHTRITTAPGATAARLYLSACKLAVLSSTAGQPLRAHGRSCTACTLLWARREAQTPREVGGNAACSARNAAGTHRQLVALRLGAGPHPPTPPPTARLA